MTYTTDPNDPRLPHGQIGVSEPQHDTYLVLSEAERAMGFIRPLHRSYTHVGQAPRYPVRDLTDVEHRDYDKFGYVAYEKYPESEAPLLGRFWTREELDRKVCGAVTTMALALCETYARDPSFYGATYCCTCGGHFPVAEFTWPDGTKVGA
jgi:hypothetical protein